MTSVRSLNLVTVAACAALLAGACGQEQSSSTGDPSLDIPAMPNPMPGQASLTGHVLDANGQGVEGAAVKIAETDGITNTDATGAYHLVVPSDSTLTLITTAAGMANTLRESVVLASGAVVSGFDIRLLPSDQMDAINALAQPGQQPTRGIVAVRLHSTDAGCATAGAHVTVYPSSAATVLYSAPASVAGGLDLPDQTLQEAQPGTEIAVWLAGALTPGNMNLLRIDVQRDGCKLMAQSPSVGGVMFLGQRQVAAKSLTETDLFLQQSP